MKTKKYLLTILALSFIFVLTFMNWETGAAQVKSLSIKRTLVAGQSATFYSGRGGVFFYKPAYSGSMVFTRTESVNTSGLLFNRPWYTIELFDSKGKTIKEAKGLTYVFYNLNKQERTDWENGNLKIYQFDAEKQIWQKCPTQYFERSVDSPFGRVMCQISRTYMTYGLVYKK